MTQVSRPIYTLWEFQKEKRHWKSQKLILRNNDWKLLELEGKKKMDMQIPESQWNPTRINSKTSTETHYNQTVISPRHSKNSFKAREK